MAVITHKRGDTFELNMTLENQGIAIDLTGWTIASQVRAGDDSLVDDLTVTITDAAAGQVTVSATAAETEQWPTGQLDWDIEFTDPSGAVSSSDTITVTVVKDITRAG